MEKDKALSDKEKFVCEMTWGVIPIDKTFIRDSKLFQGNFKKFQEMLGWYELYKNRTQYGKKMGE